MEEPSSCRTRLISDAPASIDAFGSHQGVATALVDLIRVEDGGKAIGLEGGWGSGKSTVINLIRKDTESDTNLVLLVFDAWAHEGDPLRRSFLETLIAAFIAAGWISEEEWNDRKDRISRRKKISQTATTPQLTSFAKRLLTSTLIVPIGFALLTAGLRNDLYLLPGPGRTPAWEVLFGLPLTIAPLFVLLWAKYRNASAEAWAILMKGTTTTIRTEAVETPEPTSVEFQSIFVDLMRAALGSETNRRAVLVVDNLDRVAPDDALSIWSSLRTFLQLSEHHPPLWFHRFWILVPYDPEGIQRLWAGADDTAKTHAYRRIAGSFLSKTFQLRLSVPPLLLSDWRTYLDQCLLEALPDHDRNDFHALYRLYALTLEAGLTPTPRNLKLYVNDIGGLHRQRQDALPLSDLAYYVLQRHRGVDVAESLRSGAALDPQVHDLLSPEIQDNLAALAFNATVPVARQLLLRDKLTRALEQCDKSALVTSASSPGFWEVLESLDLSQWSEREPSKLANAAVCIAESGIVEAGDSVMQRNTLSNLRAGALAVARWQPLGAELAHGLSSLCQVCPDQHLAEHLLVSLSTDESKGAQNLIPADWCLTVVAVLETLRDLSLQAAFSDGITIPGPAQTILSVCHHLTECDVDAHFWKVFRIKTLPEDLQRAIDEGLNDDSILPTLVTSLQVLRSIGAAIGWDTVVSTARSRLEQLDALTAMSVQTLLDILVYLRADVPSARKALSALAAGGHLLHHLASVYPKPGRGSAPTASRCLILHLEAEPSLSSPAGAGRAVQGHQVAMQIISTPPDDFVSALTKYLSNTGYSSQLFRVTQANADAEPLALACVRHAVSSDDVAAFFPPETVWDQWPILSKLLTDQEDSEAFAKLLMEKSEFLGHLKTREFDPDHGSLYALMVRAGAPEEIHQVCVAGLRGIDLPRWRTEFQEERNLTDLIVDLGEANVHLELGHQYCDALLEHARSTAAGSAKPSYLRSKHWRHLLSPLHPDARTVFRSGLLDAAMEIGGKVAPEFFEFYGKELAHAETLNEERAISRLFTPLLKECNPDGLRWMIAFLKAESHFLNSHRDQAAVRDFRRRLKEMLESERDEDSDGTLSLCAELAETIGLKHQRDPQAKEDD